MVLVVMLKVVLNEFELLILIFCTKRHFCLISNMTIFRWLTISRAKHEFKIPNIRKRGRSGLKGLIYMEYPFGFSLGRPDAHC